MPSSLHESRIAWRREVLADTLKEEMARRNWLQADLAKECGVSEPTISNLMNRKVDPSPQTLNAIMDCLDWSVATIQRMYYGQPGDEEQLVIDQITRELADLSLSQLRGVRDCVRQLVSVLTRISSEE